MAHLAPRALPSLVAAALGAWLGCATARAEDDHVLQAMGLEIDRAMAQLGQADKDLAPYFISIEVTRTEDLTVAADDGALYAREPTVGGWADVDVRIGSPALDSSHALRSDRDANDVERGGSRMPLTEDVELLRRALWKEIDARYQAARARWALVQAEHQVLVDEKRAEDLSPATPTTSRAPTAHLAAVAKAWESVVRDASAAFTPSPSIIDSSATVTARVVTRWFASSEGTRLRDSESRYRTWLDASARASDGTDLGLYRSWDADGPEGLPAAPVVTAGARLMRNQLEALLQAPAEEPYSGPAILSDRAAGVLFHEVFGHRVEGHRLKRVDDAQTFRNRVGEQILPPFLSVLDDPTLADIAGHALRGHYLFDNQGVAARRVTLVDHGVLRGFLESRSPVEHGGASNGHGRRQPGSRAVSRQGTLLVVADKSQTDAELREELIRRVKEAGLEHGLFIDEIEGGFTFTERSLPNAFAIKVLLAHRVHADGRPDELVRGIDLIGTPLAAFSGIVAAGELHDVFNGDCGAESGWVPVSAAAPSLLLEKIETQRQRKGQQTPPILPAPTGEAPARDGGRS